MKFFQKYRFTICLALLVTVSAVTAVQARKALTGRREPEPILTVEAKTGDQTLLAEAYARVRPSEGALIRGYSPDQPTWSSTLKLYETHEGCDFSGAEEVFACADGKVTEVAEDWLYGLRVCILHDDGAFSVYASLSEAGVRKDQRVCAGDRIGMSGDSALCEAEMGAHLHFEYVPADSGENLCALYTEEAVPSVVNALEEDKYAPHTEELLFPIEAF